MPIRDSSVGIATGRTAGDRFRQGQECFLFSTMSRPALGPTQPSIQWVPGAVSHGVKRLWREAGHSSIWCRGHEWWSQTSTRPYVFMA
jgi:hypothetical protein